MPIYDQSFRRYTGTRNLTRLWWPVAWYTFRPVLRRVLIWILGVFFLLYLASISIFLIASLQIKNQIGESQTASIMRDMRRSGVRVFGDDVPMGTILYSIMQPVQSLIWLVILVAGAGCISSDRRHNALPLYFSRPLLSWQYTLGKILGVALLPTAALLLTQWLIGLQYVAYFKPVSNLLTELPTFLMGAVVAVVQCGFAATAMVAFSSMAKSARVAGVAFLGFLVLMKMIIPLLAFSSKQWILLSLSPQHSLDVISRGIMGARLDKITTSIETGGLTVPVSLVSVACYMALFIIIIRNNLRVVEVVK